MIHGLVSRKNWVVSLAFILLSCSADLKRVVDVPTIPPPSDVTVVPGQSSVAVFDFRDLRPGRNIQNQVDGTILPSGAVATVVQDSFGRALEKNGLRLSPDASLSVKGEIREWQAKTTSEFIPSVEASAKLFLEVFDAKDNRLYAGNYTGAATTQQPFVSRSAVESVLGDAMSEAFRQALADEQLRSVLFHFGQ